MKVLVLSNGNFMEKEINHTLEALQNIVEGYIEIPFISEKFYNENIDMIINEEGKLLDGMKMEIAITADGNSIADIIFGNVIFASHNEEGDTIGLSEKQINFVKKELKQMAFVGENIVRVLFV